jgi:3',5'-cyclic AMP phosphodiesterase CpdA
MLTRRTYLTRLALLAPAVSNLGVLRSAPRESPPAPAPGTIPSRIILGWTGDPAHTQAVTWRTEVAVQSPQAQIAKLDADPDFEKKASTVAAAAVRDDLAAGKTAMHYAANFQGLAPNTRYCYRVGDENSWSGWNEFRTASDKAEPFRFLYVGDAQNKIASLCPRTMRMAYAAAPDARFIVHAGDLVAEGYDDTLWGEWSEAFGFVTAMVPSLPVVGNHDLHHAADDHDPKRVLSASPLWRHHFAVPANGPGIEEMPSQSYYLDYQGVRFISLDTNVFASESDKIDPELQRRVAGKEVEWLTKALSGNPNHWTIVSQHQAIYSAAKGRNYVAMRDLLTPLYEKHGVDLVLQGHDHVYSRSHKVARDRVVDPSAPGVIYAISVSGPKMYELEPLHRELMARQTQHKQLFQAIDVSPEKLKFSAYSVDNVLADSFELRKNGKGSTYVNHASAV